MAARWINKRWRIRLWMDRNGPTYRTWCAPSHRRRPCSRLPKQEQSRIFSSVLCISVKTLTLVLLETSVAELHEEFVIPVTGNHVYPGVVRHPAAVQPVAAEEANGENGTSCFRNQKQQHHPAYVILIQFLMEESKQSVSERGPGRVRSAHTAGSLIP